MGCNCGKSRESALAELNKRAPEPKPYNVFDVMKDAITGNTEYASNEVVDKRIAICKRCPHLKTLPMGINGTGNCSKCGCFVDFKAKHTKSNCPVFKW